MCGVSACISINKQTKKMFIDNAIALQYHRGPDASGIWEDDFVSLGHNRLSILDLSDAGSQPMLSSSGRYVITFNGEIYNHIQLRKRFLPNQLFKGHSDTETILALYEKMGANMQQHLVGMWVILIWDRVDKRLFISRDRYGQKPLYWVYHNQAFFFSSEINPLFQVVDQYSINKLAVSEYLTFGNYDHLFDLTFINEINNFLPAHYAEVTLGSKVIDLKDYWNIEEVPYKERLTFGNAEAKELKDLVMEAVQSQLLSDVPVGATLSGGLDSSIIVSCIAELGFKNFPVFSAQFPDSKFDESKYVEALKGKYGSAIDLVYAPVGEMSLKNDLEKSISLQEEPFGDPSIIGHRFLVNEAKKAGVKVLLGGQGGDEVSMGYSWMYQRTMAYALNSGDIASYIKFSLQDEQSLPVSLRMLVAGMFPSVEQTTRIKSRLKQKAWLKPAYHLKTPSNVLGSVSKFTDVYLESLKTVGIPHLCHYDDRSCMAQSIEGRMPFLDHRIMEYAARLRPDAFYNKGYSKNIFRKSFRDLLPSEISNRKDKIGFYTPLIKLIEKDKDWIYKTFEINRALVLEWIDLKSYNYIVVFLKEGSLDINWALRIFRILSLIQWVLSIKKLQTRI